MLKTQNDVFMACDAPYGEADTVLTGAPFDGTASFRPGARFAPAAIRRESYGIETYSPYLDRDLEDGRIFDSGDLDLPFGDTETVLSQIAERTEKILADGKRPFLVGGEHLVTLGAVRAVAKRYPDLSIVHFDAHADLRDEYLGVTLSHACVLRRCWELIGDGRIHQFGIRSGTKGEFSWAEAHTRMHRFGFGGLEETVAALGGRPVYFTVDLDVLDPSAFPGTGTPEPGGVSFDALRAAASFVCAQANIVGLDVTELSPHYDASGISTAAACKIIREMLLSLNG